MGCCPLETGWEVVNWIHLAQDRDQWWALVNMVNELLGSIKGGKFLYQMNEC
jgi:hypothetical protein